MKRPFADKRPIVSNFDNLLVDLRFIENPLYLEVSVFVKGEPDTVTVEKADRLMGDAKRVDTEISGRRVADKTRVTMIYSLHSDTIDEGRLKEYREKFEDWFMELSYIRVGNKSAFGRLD